MASRGTTWGDEVKVLSEIWGDEKIQNELDGAKRKHPLHEKIAREPGARGNNRDADEIKTKIKNLKSTYRSIKDHNNKTGSNKKVGSFLKNLMQSWGIGQHPPLQLFWMHVLEDCLLSHKRVKEDMVSD